MTLQELRAALDAAHTERAAITEAAEARFADADDTTEVRGAFVVDDDGQPTTTPDPLAGFTADEATRWAELDDDIASLTTRIDRGEAIERQASRPGAIATAPQVAPAGSTDDPQDFERARIATPSEVRGQALTMLEDLRADDRVKEGLTGLLDHFRGSDVQTAVLARHIIAAGSDDYRAATLAHVTGRPLTEAQTRAAAAVEEQRAALELGSGWTLPVTVDPTMVRTGDVEANPVRELATVDTVVTNQTTINTIGAVTASWDLELDEVSDDTPTPASVTITNVKPQGFVQFSMESEQDMVGLEAELLGLIGESKTNLEASGFMTGTGVAPQPQGLITGMVAAAATCQVLTAGVGAFAEADLYALRASLQQRHRPMAEWIAEQSVFDLTRQFESANGARLWQPSLTAGNPDVMIGRPAFESSVMDAAPVAAGEISVIYGDISAAFRITDRVGMTITPIPVMFGANQRPIAKRGLFFNWRTGSAVVNPNAVRYLEIAA